LGEVAHAVGAPQIYPTYVAAAQASWELDLFGSLRRARAAAVADAQAAEVNQAAVRIAVTAEAADAYIVLRGLQARMRLANSQALIQGRLADLVGRRVAKGLSSNRDLERATAELERVRASIPPLRAAIDGEQYRLDVLMGTPAGSHTTELAGDAAQPLAPRPTGSAVPADLLRRRPDMVIAERHLAAASARIGVAVAEYYPHLTFGGLLGYESIATGDLFTNAARQAMGVAGLRWRLFDFGRVDAEVAVARGREAEALAAYRGAALRATEDVESALSRFIESESEETALRREIEALIRARDEAQTAYEGGVLPLIEVLDADRDLLAARDRLVTAKANEARAAVAAFRAFGGGWTG
jgi:NodT family efflux transporter outer membrane factor (OMF) lipoprotein